MPVPKRKRSRSRRDKRFANKRVFLTSTSNCPTCSVPVGSHQICKECGCYRGKKILRTKAERAEKRGSVKAKKGAKQKFVDKNKQLPDGPKKD